MTKTSHSQARIFPVTTRFQKMAQRPGGVPYEEAIERAQSYIDELKPAFHDWLDDKLHQLTVMIRRLDQDPGDPARWDDAFQCCCQLQDVAATMGFEHISIFSRNLCEVLDAIKTGAAYQKETIECYVDAINLTGKPPYKHLPPDQLAEMTDGLRRLLDRTKNCTSEPTKSVSA